MLEFLAATGSGGAFVLLFLLVLDVCRHRTVVLFCLLVVTAIVHMMMPWTAERFHVASYLTQSFAAGLFWLNCHVIFYDNQKLPRPLLLIFAISVVPSIIYHTFILGTEQQEFYLLAMKIIPQYCEYLLAVLGLRIIFVSWQNDVVESRRRLRYVIVLSGAALCWALVSNNFGVGAPVLRLLILNIVILGFFVLLFKSNDDVWGNRVELQLERPLSDNDLVKEAAELEVALAVDSQINRAADKSAEDLIKLQILMETGIYRDENISIKMLAECLDMPEYRIRGVINKNLAYRNFNEFLHTYRITEASVRLKQEPETPISNIALDVGYRSLSSFNRAFKTIKQTTPTEYREVDLVK